VTTMSTSTDRGEHTDRTTDEDLVPTVQELELAWRAVRAGQFRRPQRPKVDARDVAGQRRTEAVRGQDDRGRVRIPEPVVVVTGAHGWAGTSTTVLLLAEAAARRGEPARVIDTASPAQSGFVGAAMTEHGVDETGQWRIGSRGPVNLQRLACPKIAAATALPPMEAADGAVSIIDATWPLHDLLKHLVLPDEPGQLAARQRHWLQAALTSSPLVLTARACVPGLRHLEHALESLEGWRAPGSLVVLALLGPRTLPRSLTAAAGVEQEVPQDERHGECPGVPLTDLLPRDGTQSILVGRVWDPSAEGPSPVLVRDGELFDLSLSFPTVRDICETRSPASAAQAAAGRSLGSTGRRCQRVAVDSTGFNVAPDRMSAIAWFASVRS